MAAPKKLKQQEEELFKSGILSVGEPCSPISVSHYRKGVEDNNSTWTEIPFVGNSSKALSKAKEGYEASHR